MRSICFLKNYCFVILIYLTLLNDSKFYIYVYIYLTLGFWKNFLHHFILWLTYLIVLKKALRYKILDILSFQNTFLSLNICSSSPRR